MKVIPLAFLLCALPATALASPAPRSAPFVVEQTYWVKPGKEREFAALYARTGLPRLQALEKDGRILWFRMTVPRFPDGNDEWDCRLTIGWRDADSATSYPDLAPLQNAGTGATKGPSFEQQMLGELVVERRETPIVETGYTGEPEN
jgi:hypothetical protein